MKGGLFNIYKMEKKSKKADKISKKKEGNLEKSSSNTQDFKSLDKGWSWVIMLTSFATLCLIGANVYGVGIMHDVLLERYNETVSLTTWAGSIHTALMNLAAPLSSFVADRFSCRTAVMLSGILFAVGYLGTAFAPNVQTAIFTLGIVAGSGAGIGTTASMLVIGYNFKRKRNIALGFVCSGMGAGLFALASLMHLAREYYGSTGFFIVQAAMSLNIVVFGATYFPSKLEKHAQEMRIFNNVDALPNGNTNLRFIEVYKQYFKALNNKPIFLLSFGMFFYCVGTHLIYLHLPVYIVHKGFSKTQASYMVSLKGIFAVIGRLLTGFVASLHKSVDIWLYSGSFLVLSVATIVYPHISNTLAGNIGYAVVLGLFFGSCYVLITSVNLSFVDIKHVSAALAFEFFVGGIGSLLGPEFAGLLIDSGGTYEQAMTFAGGCLFIAAFSSILTKCFHVDSKTGENKIIWKFTRRKEMRET